MDTELSLCKTSLTPSGACWQPVCVNTIRCTNVVLALAKRCRRWANVNLKWNILTPSGACWPSERVNMKHRTMVDPMMSERRRRLTNVKQNLAQFDLLTGCKNKQNWQAIGRRWLPWQSLTRQKMGMRVWYAERWSFGVCHCLCFFALGAWIPLLSSRWTERTVSQVISHWWFA